MIRFIMKSFVLVSVLLFGILLGMQQVSVQMDKMKGTESNGALEWKVEENGKVEADVLGQEITSHDLKEKQEKLEEIEAYNVFSSLGAKVSALISELLTVTLTTISTIINKLFYFFFG
ncbi:YqxA family protein [Pseudalkalibacillus decolorationis]|uniref:YqxA family protein n=1 Tax=Pseudalkalibacillus decolorationis TaxID=163879 RepID=UPI002147260C|nr:YqxA family protein [Pseudalkalibacillus decolorationis]